MRNVYNIVILWVKPIYNYTVNVLEVVREKIFLVIFGIIVLKGFSFFHPLGQDWANILNCTFPFCLLSFELLTIQIPMQRPCKLYYYSFEPLDSFSAIETFWPYPPLNKRANKFNSTVETSETVKEHLIWGTQYIQIIHDCNDKVYGRYKEKAFANL